ncbi:NAD-dependent succinate-semialdehyde dehydrogenase [Tenuibacillus multivorans]|uniref:Aldehyde dehydrogenase n=1 Tax=Tenuibacillus multivorans TaxID=237069 RepID=A0A1H0ERY0_9BACI|nr:NAD-dependent succinate-semialdehyde dehydrogenase [Tenuibacillus multivorans]GEL76981.1 NAD-dependent succinate-semialdehyde dehydrogenase [Tenuibacillus multivorans]SDN85121.1 succinate-semialdehyde dehydrogenase / glutarate-semialdehyde dehydrogenase [Tenuibacillus multivorans]
MVKTYELLINGEWIGKRYDHIDVLNPATQEVMAQVPKVGRVEAAKAVDSAHQALSTWSSFTAQKRGKLLEKWHDLIEDEAELIGKLMTKEQGKPLKETIGEVNYANGFIDWYAEEGKRIYGDIIPSSHPDKRIFVQHQPVGVVAAITPWNFPAAMITRKVAPALAAGCTVVLKPATQTPLTAIKLVELADKAGIPKGVINIITGSSSEIGKTWSEDSRVRKLTFTGSTEVGKILMRDAAETMKKISLELGGHAPVIVMDDADINKAVNGVIQSKFRNAGQTCICANRVYVHESIEQEFIHQLNDEVKKLKVGNGLEEGIDIGPLIDRYAIEKVEHHVSDALKQGAKLQFGGQRVEVGQGHYYQPTVISNVTDDMICMNEETFGPLIPVTTFSSEDEVVQRANHTPYGLASYIFTENIGRAIRLSEGLEYGIIGLNDGAPSTPQAPFGGFKESGLGREGGYYGIEEYLETKYISVGI